MTKDHLDPIESASAGPLTAEQSVHLIHLATQQRLFNRLDWWMLSEWVLSDAFTYIASADRITAALLAVPVSFDDLNTIRSSRSHCLDCSESRRDGSARRDCAWLRWCAVEDGVSATRALKALFEYGDSLWLNAGITDTYCIVEPGHWFSHYLRDNGYRRVDEVITMICHDPAVAGLSGYPVDDMKIRTALTSDLEAISDIDRQAFDEQWRYPAFVLKRALQTSAYCSVAVQDKKIVAYQVTFLSENSAHITRLAVHPASQGRGVGGTMLVHALSIMQTEYGVKSVTLNTQASNLASQRLYGRFGFVALHPRFRVVQKTHGV